MAAIEASPVPKKSTGFELSPVFGLVLFMFDVPVDVRVRPPVLPLLELPDDPDELLPFELPDEPDELPPFELPDDPDELLPDELPPLELPDEPDDLF